MRVHEGLAREKSTFDPATTLCMEDIKFVKTKINGKDEELLKVTLNVQKSLQLEMGLLLKYLPTVHFSVQLMQ
jgi:hypothetical protein